jgi:hypothetical protein
VRVAIVLRMRSEDLLQCRFAVSPLGETAAALRSLVLTGREGYHLRWQRQVRGRLPSLGLDPLLAVLRLRGYQPDFISPAPSGPFTEFAAEIGRVRATPPGRAGAELATMTGTPAGQAVARRHPELAGDPGAARDLLAGLLERAWSELVEPWWPRLRDVLDADITYRARQLADAGVAVTLNDLHAKISWSGGAVRFTGPAQTELDVAGTELVLIPSVFGWPGAGVAYDPPSLTYPARGVALIWQPPDRADGALAALVGPTRAGVLTALAEPASTTGLAARCGLPASTASEHLSVLRAAGLVATVRTGRFLLHQRTPLGVALCGG